MKRDKQRTETKKAHIVTLFKIMADARADMSEKRLNMAAGYLVAMLNEGYLKESLDREIAENILKAHAAFLSHEPEAVEEARLIRLADMAKEVLLV